ncbi:MAG TPA: hypothetical protein VFJ16_28990 [Longimicrobium sp.]|nr:hypothetical protein [Longimicrobium sp.]
MRDRIRSVAALLFTIPLVVIAAPARAQAVPGDLVRALLATPSATAGAPEIVVGSVPRGFPAELVPGGGRVLGGYRRDTMAVVVATAVAQDPAAAGDAAQLALASAGFTLEDMYGGRGFVGPSSRQWRYLCRGREMVTLSSAAAPDGGSYVRVEYAANQRSSRCSPPFPQGSPWRDVPMPALTIPASATVATNGMGIMVPGDPNGGAKAHTRLRTSMSPSGLVENFAAQLRQAGWTEQPPTAGGDVAVQTFRRRTDDGKEWFGALTAVAIPDSEVRDVDFAVSPLPPPSQ